VLQRGPPQRVLPGLVPQSDLQQDQLLTLGLVTTTLQRLQPLCDAPAGLSHEAVPLLRVLLSAKDDSKAAELGQLGVPADDAVLHQQDRHRVRVVAPVVRTQPQAEEQVSYQLEIAFLVAGCQRERAAGLGQRSTIPLQIALMSWQVSND